MKSWPVPIMLAFAICRHMLFPASAPAQQLPVNLPTAPLPNLPAEANPAAAPAVVPEKRLPPYAQEMYRSARQGMDWLLSMNRQDGRFHYGFVPALGVALEGDNYLHQAAAAFTLARAARYFKHEQAAAVARQAVLTLLLETEKDAQSLHIRHTVFPELQVNRLASAGWLVLAISELPDPGDELVKQSEELCNYIRTQQHADGSLGLARATAPEATALAENAAGIALYALMRSLQHQKADWKLESVRKARVYYHARWREQKSVALAGWHGAAFAEAFLLTREQVFADNAQEMNDWLCTLQYRQTDPRRALWFGGFQSWQQGRPQMTAPGVHAARNMEPLVQGCRVARETGDLQRYQSYKQTLERCGLFLTALQYNGSNTQHFHPRYREPLLGGFHPTHQDGTLRLDYTQEAVCGLLKYLHDVAENP